MQTQRAFIDGISRALLIKDIHEDIVRLAVKKLQEDSETLSERKKIHISKANDITSVNSKRRDPVLPPNLLARIIALAPIAQRPFMSFTVNAFFISIAKSDAFSDAWKRELLADVPLLLTGHDLGMVDFVRGKEELSNIAPLAANSWNFHLYSREPVPKFYSSASVLLETTLSDSDPAVLRARFDAAFDFLWHRLSLRPMIFVAVEYIRASLRRCREKLSSLRVLDVLPIVEICPEAALNENRAKANEPWMLFDSQEPIKSTIMQARLPPFLFPSCSPILSSVQKLEFVIPSFCDQVDVFALLPQLPSFLETLAIDAHGAHTTNPNRTFDYSKFDEMSVSLPGLRQLTLSSLPMQFVLVLMRIIKCQGLRELGCFALKCTPAQGKDHATRFLHLINEQYPKLTNMAWSSSSVMVSSSLQLSECPISRFVRIPNCF